MSSLISLVFAALPVALAATMDVSVGEGGLLAFNPPTVAAQPGDIINFVFHPKNHTVTQSSFDAPCTPLAGGQDSSFHPVADESVGLPTFQFTVPDTNPKWFFCQQTGHCSKGMVFAINAPADPDPHSFSAFQTSAKATNPDTASPPAPSPSSTDTVSPPTASGQPTDHKIVVGADGQLVYSPSNIQAVLGDTVTFEFQPKNHTVTQSSFGAPCQPLAATSGTPGFTSGFMPVSPDATTFPTFQILINDTKPIWGYCGQTNHCGSGMVFSINAPTSGNTFEAFQDSAKKLNGTTSSALPPASTGATSSSGAPSPSSSAGSNDNSAVALSRGSFAAGSGIALVAAVFTFLL